MAFWSRTTQRIWTCALMSTLFALFAGGALAEDNARWTATWTASPQAMLGPEIGIDPGVPSNVADQTVRQIVHVSVGGRAVRIELSNAYGAAPLVIGEARIARTDAGAAIEEGSDRQLTFGGAPGVTIPTGAPAISDPVELEVSALSDLTVSLYIPQPTTIDMFHWTGQQTGYLAAGNVSSALDLTADSTFTPRLFVSAVHVAESAYARGGARAVAALGDSITDGSSASLDANQRWPDLLAQRLAPYHVGAVNAGISGSQLLHSEGMGDNAIARFQRDVLSQPGVDTAIFLIGINDLGVHTPVPTAAELIAGYRQLIAQAHSADVRIFGGTIGPFAGAYEESGYFTPEKELVRSAVNAWIRDSGELDGVVDFDLALRDPAQPTHIQAAFDSGDHLHPNDAGYQAMADAIDLRALLRKR